jgi:hypothetical protein
MSSNQELQMQIETLRKLIQIRNERIDFLTVQLNKMLNKTTKIVEICIAEENE